MDLWIRSQDKKTLIPINKMLTISCSSMFYDGLILGVYKTEQRALKVLDEIQIRLINLQLVGLEEKGQARKDARINDELKCIYEMPKE